MATVCVKDFTSKVGKPYHLVADTCAGTLGTENACMTLPMNFRVV